MSIIGGGFSERVGRDRTYKTERTDKSYKTYRTYKTERTGRVGEPQSFDGAQRVKDTDGQRLNYIILTIVSIIWGGFLYNRLDGSHICG